MPVNLTDHTAAVIRSAKAVAEAMNALFDADNLAVDHLSDNYEDGEDWDPLDDLYNLAREINETLFTEMNEICKPLGFEIKFNRLYPRYETVESPIIRKNRI